MQKAALGHEEAGPVDEAAAEHLRVVDELAHAREDLRPEDLEIGVDE